MSAARPGPLRDAPTGPLALDALAEWVGIPSVSAEPGRSDDVRRSARWLADRLGEGPFPRAEVWETDGLPAVYGCLPAADPGAPVLLVYSHHDVHVVDGSEWRVTRPFRPLRRDGRLYGRGRPTRRGR
ncbi:hypothetical protein AB6O49_31100 [Streptomyces sp. SBR177]